MGGIDSVDRPPPPYLHPQSVSAKISVLDLGCVSSQTVERGQITLQVSVEELSRVLEEPDFTDSFQSQEVQMGVCACVCLQTADSHQVHIEVRGCATYVTTPRIRRIPTYLIN